ncbi:MAG: PTS sugar transporter subunit IIC [Holdemania massiliensis]
MSHVYSSTTGGLVLYLAWLLDSIFGFQTATRPLILGTITGLLCGDLKTGVVMGAAWKRYMGISGIGGVTALPIIVPLLRLRSV